MCYVPLSAVYVASGSIKRYIFNTETRYINRVNVNIYNTPVLANSIGLISMNYPVTVLATDGSFYFVEYKVSATGKLKRGYIWNSQLSAVKTENTPITIEIKNKITHMYVAQSYSAMRAEVRPYGVGNVVWHSSDENRVWIDENTGRIIQTFISGTSVITASVVDPQGNVRASTSFTITVEQKLNYPDTLITKQKTKSTLLTLKRLQDEAFNAHLHGQVNNADYSQMRNELDYEMDLIRAGYVVEGKNPTSDFALAFCKAPPTNASPFNRILRFNEAKPLTGPDVMVFQLALQLYGLYEDEEFDEYGIYEEETKEAAAKAQGLMTWEDGLQIFNPSKTFTVLFNTENANQRTSDAIIRLFGFRSQHRQVQEYCRDRLNKDSPTTMAAIEVTIEEGSLTGKYGRADLMAKGTNGSYIWEVKHDSKGGETLGRKQLSRYIEKANDSSLDQEIMIGTYKFERPVLMGQQLFEGVAIELSSGEYINLRHDTIMSGLILYDKTKEKLPEYEVVPVTRPVENWEKKKSFDLVEAVEVNIGYSPAYADSIAIDPATGLIVIGVTLVITGIAVICVYSGGIAALAALGLA